MMNKMTIRRTLLAGLFCCALAQVSPLPVLGDELPTLSEMGISNAALQHPEQRTGIIMEVNGQNRLVMFEETHLMSNQTQINGASLEKNSYLLRVGIKAKIVRYRISRKDPKYYISSITIP
jgi:hypothetical protein